MAFHKHHLSLLRSCALIFIVVTVNLKKKKKRKKKSQSAAKKCPHPNNGYLIKFTITFEDVLWFT